MRNFLETERLALRPFTTADAESVRALDNDREVMRFINGGRPTTRATVRDETLPRLRRRYAWSAEHGFWAAEAKATGDFLGWFEFRPLDPPEERTVELGYRLVKAAWGHGYATEGARALIRKGFDELEVRRVMATTMTVNTRSRRVMENSGLTYVRTFHEDWPDPIDGAARGDVEYALTEAGWRGRVFPAADVRGVRVLRRQPPGACSSSFAEVTMDFEALPPGEEGCVFADRTGPRALPPEYAAAVEEGVREQLPRTPYARVAVRVVLTAGRHHEVDSSESAFVRAGRQAVEDAVRRLCATVPTAPE